MKHCHAATVIYIIFKYFPFAILPLLSGLISVLRNGSFFAGSIYYSTGVLFAVVVYAVSAWRATTYTIENGSFILRKGIIAKRTITIPIESIAFCSASYELMSIFGAQRIAIDTIAGGKKRHDVQMYLSYQSSKELLSSLGGSMNEVEILHPSPIKIIFLAATVSHSASGILLLSPILSALSKLLDISISRELYGEANRIAKSYLSALPPILGVSAIILLLGWAISFAVNLQRYSRMKILQNSHTSALQAGFIFQRYEILQKHSVAAISIRQTLIGRLLGLGTVYLNVPGFSKGHNGGMFLPMQSKRELNRADVTLPCFETENSGVFTARFAWYKLIMVPLSFALGIILLTLYVSFIYKGSLGATLLVSFVGLSLCGHQILFSIAEYKHCKIDISNGRVNMISRRRNRICAVAAQLCNISIKVKRNIFQRMDGTCTVVVRIQSEIPEHYKIRHINFDDMMRIWRKRM